jgi:transglutaminase-like putative cysteine protease
VKKEILLDFFMKGIMFTLIAGGLAHSLFYSLAIPFSVWFTFALTAIMYVILSVYLWNLWTSVLFLPVSIISVFAYVHYIYPDDWYLDMFHNIDLMVNYILGYGLLEPENMLYMALILLSLISLVIYAVAILLERFFLTLFTGLTMIGVLWFLGHFDIVSFVWPFALGVILMLAESHRQSVSSGNQAPNYGRWQLSALPLAMAVTLTASAVLPADTRELRWHFLEDVALEANDTLWDWFTIHEPQSGFRLWQTGFAPTTGRLGGPVTLNHEIAMHVNSPKRVFLRGAVLNQYTGYTWNDTTEYRAHSFADLHIDHMKDVAFDRFEPAYAETYEKTKDDLFERINVRINHTGIVTSVLFNANKLYNVTFAEPVSQIYFSMAGETFATREIKPDESYILDILLPNKYSRAFRQHMNQLPFIDWSQPIPREISSHWGLNHHKLSQIQRYYTELPDTVTDRVIELTNEIISPARTPFEKANAIESFLKNNLDYTLSPPHTPEDVDFVDHFLFDLRIGYCTYFATAFAVMGRIAGLPTRYVEGFLMPPTPIEGNLYEIRQSNAHAWAEVYFPGVGWLSYDPTPPIEDYFVERGYVPGVSSVFPYNDYMDPYWEFIQGMWMASSPGTGGTPAIPPHTPVPQENASFVLPSPPLLAAIVTAGILFVITLLFVGILAAHKYKQIGRDKLPYELRLKSYFKEILWLLTLYEYPVRKGETPYLYAQRVDSWLVNDAGTMMDVAGLLVKSEFGYHQLTEYDLELVRKFHKNLEISIKYVLGRLKFYAILGTVLLRGRI